MVEEVLDSYQISGILCLIEYVMCCHTQLQQHVVFPTGTFSAGSYTPSYMVCSFPLFYFPVLLREAAI